MLTRDDIERALPANLKSAATQSLTDLVNNITSDPIAADTIRDNFIGYAAILKDGKFRTEDYLHAVTYVSFKLMGYTNRESYEKTFPQRYATLIANGTSSKDIAAYVAAYHRGKLVNLIMEQTLVPTWVLNQHIYQEAINTQAELMRTANSEKVRSDAADSLLNHLKKPEVKEFQLSMEVKENSGMTELKNALRTMVEKQRELISSGAPTALIAAEPLVEGEFKEVDDADQTEPG